MDRSTLSKDIISKMSGYTWIALGNIPNNAARINMLITIEASDVRNFRSKIESLGCSMINIFENKATVKGNLESLLYLAKSDFVKYIEIGMQMSKEMDEPNYE